MAGRCRATDFAEDGSDLRCTGPAEHGNLCARHGLRGTAPRFPIADDADLVPEEVAFHAKGTKLRRCLRILPTNGRCENVTSLFPYCEVCTAVKERLWVTVIGGCLALVAFDETRKIVFAEGDVVSDAVHLCSIPNGVREGQQWKHVGVELSSVRLDDFSIQTGPSRWMDTARLRPTLAYAVCATQRPNARMVGTALVATKPIQHGDRVVVAGKHHPPVPFARRLFRPAGLWVERPSHVGGFEPWVQRLYRHIRTTQTCGLSRAVLCGVNREALEVLKRRAGPTHPNLTVWALVLLMAGGPESPADARATWCAGVTADGLERLGNAPTWNEQDAAWAGEVVGLLTGEGGGLDGVAEAKADSFLSRRMQVRHRRIYVQLLQGVKAVGLDAQESVGAIDRRCAVRIIGLLE